MIRRPRQITARLVALFGAGLIAATATLPLGATAQMTELRRGGAEARVSAEDGLEPAVFARRLGTISAMVRDADGTVFVADEAGGRIFRLTDRGGDGRLDTRQALPHRFDMPSGLAVDGRTLFVADRSGLWTVEVSGTPRLLAPFAKAGATDAPHPILLRPDGTLLLGLSKPDGTAMLVSVERATGRATQIDSGAGEIIAFANIPGLDIDLPPETEELFPRIRTPWLILRRGDRTFLARARAGGMAEPLPVGGRASAVLMNPEKGPALIGNADGLFVSEGSITGVAPTDDAVLRGVRIDAMIWDDRSPMIGDRESGTVWTLLPSEAEPTRPAIKTQEIVSPGLQPAPTDAPPEDLLLRGSNIGKASTLDEARPPQSQGKIQPDRDSE